MKIDEAVELAAARNGVDPAFEDEVKALAEMPDANWPRCCNSDCDPCVTTLIRAALLARKLSGETRPEAQRVTPEPDPDRDEGCR